MISDHSEASLLRMHEVSFSRGGNRLLGALNLSIFPGDVVWLRGQNGQGKTSLLKLAMKLVQPDAGGVNWGTLHASAQVPAFVGHNNGLKDDLSVRQAVTFAARLHGWIPDQMALASALQRLSLYRLRNLPVAVLSQGEKRRAALARLLLNKAVLWILDEPLDALDTTGIQTVLEMLDEHAQAGGAVLMTSHIPVQLQRLKTFDLMALQTL